MFFCLTTTRVIYSQERRGIRFGDYFSFLTIGDWSYRKTNICDEDYNYCGGWIYGKVVWDRLDMGGKNRHLPLGIYVSGTIVNSNQNKPWENNYVLGFGVEKYLFDGTKGIPSIIRNLRLYAEYLKIGYTKEKAEEWVPDSDIRFGFDIYKDYGLGRGQTHKIFWHELWLNVCWQKTNFYMEDYKSLTASCNYKIGFRLPKGIQVSLMPYLVNEVSWSARHDFFWQNRALLGIGLRLMPFQAAEFDLWNRFKIFTEYLRVVASFKDVPPFDTPEFDLRIGIVFSVGLWR